MTQNGSKFANRARERERKKETCALRNNVTWSYSWSSPLCLYKLYWLNQLSNTTNLWYIYVYYILLHQPEDGHKRRNM